MRPSPSLCFRHQFAPGGLPGTHAAIQLVDIGIPLLNQHLRCLRAHASAATVEHNRRIFRRKLIEVFAYREVLLRARAIENGYIDEEFYNSFATENTAIVGELYGSETLKDALINHFEFKLEHLLKWEDRNSMWFSIEARVPFLDHRLVERTISLNDDLIINDGMTKYILREAMKGRLPEPIRMRKDKIGFGTPHDEWFRTPVFQKYIKDIIYSPAFASRGLVDVKKVQDLYARHLNRNGNYGKEIWKWIHMEKWFNAFID